MATSKGKKFEECVENSFNKTFPKENRTIDRIYDTQGYHIGIRNISDFIGYVFPYHYYLEAKSLHGNTFNLKKLTQYDKLVEKIGTKGVVTGVVIWFIDHKKVVFVDIEKVKELKEQGKKSINITIPSDISIEFNTTIKRVYPDIDFSKLYEYSQKRCI